MKNINLNKGKYTLVSFEELRIKELTDTKKAKLALKIALEEYEQDGDLLALLDFFRQLAKAQGGLAKIAKKSKISRQALHSALSEDGNPKIKTFEAILKTLGYRMSFKPININPKEKRI
ncbi:MAG: hypothetical protein SFT90_01610 [Rickettsiales bacterium]|nr:hypothetical protein [Rickettsiales bacterium]